MLGVAWAETATARARMAKTDFILNFKNKIKN
jgi:hypothetical protein